MADISQSITDDFEDLNPPAVLVFTSVQSVPCANISIVDDILIEPTEIFSVTLGSNEVQVIIDSNLNTTQVLIADNDSELNPSTSSLSKHTNSNRYFHAHRCCV